MKQLVILAGGKGTRLRSRLGDLPKPMVDVCGMPLIEHQILLAKQNGFNEIILLIGYGAAAIRNFCQQKNNWDINITCIEEKELLGTAGAVIAAADYLHDQFVVMYGDTMLNVDLQRLWRSHVESCADATLFLHPNDHPHDSDLVEIDHAGYITKFYPYPHNPEKFYPNLVNAALYVLNKAALVECQNLITLPGDFAKNLFPAMLSAGKKMFGYCSPEYIKDAGTPERLDKVSKDLLSGKIQCSSLSVPAPAIFLDRDGVLNQELNHIKSPQEFHLIDGVAEAVKAINYSEYRAIVITNQPVIARGDCTETQLQQIHNKLDTLLGKSGAYVDGLFYCPHHPDKGFDGERSELKMSCNCRKPGVALIEQAKEKFNIDLGHSWFIGDTTVDIQTAKNAGVKSILLRTGHAGCDYKYKVQPDFVFYTFSDTVDFIINKYPPLLEKAKKLSSNIKPGETIAIGGLARSGKSTWASVLAYALKEKGLDATIINFDDLLRSVTKSDTRGVLSRHQLEAIDDFVDEILSIHQTNALKVPSYGYKTRAVALPEQRCFNAGHVIIFDGVVALLSEQVKKNAKIKFYIDHDNAVCQEEFIWEYQWHNISLKEMKKS